jgi:hypothetical protein
MSDANSRLQRLERRVLFLERRLDELEFLPAAPRCAPDPPGRQAPEAGPPDPVPDPPQACEFLPYHPPTPMTTEACMATKAQELASLDDRSSCLGRCSDDEPIFVLRAQDRSMPAIVRVWLEIALLHGLPYAKQDEVNALLAAAERWQRANHAVVKWPD